MFEPGKMAQTVACQLCTKTDRLSTQLRFINFIKVKCIFSASDERNVQLVCLTHI